METTNMYKAGWTWLSCYIGLSHEGKNDQYWWPQVIIDYPQMNTMYLINIQPVLCKTVSLEHRSR